MRVEHSERDIRVNQIGIVRQPDCGTSCHSAANVADNPSCAFIPPYAPGGGQKLPVLRNLSAWARFVHNGAAETLDDLVAFLKAL
jgi:hypothetical protein